MLLVLLWWWWNVERYGCGSIVIMTRISRWWCMNISCAWTLTVREMNKWSLVRQSESWWSARHFPFSMQMLRNWFSGQEAGWRWHLHFGAHSRFRSRSKSSKANKKTTWKRRFCWFRPNKDVKAFRWWWWLRRRIRDVSGGLGWWMGMFFR